MLAVRNTETGIRAVPLDPAPPAEGVTLRVASAGICGTDVSFAAMGVRGFTYGHEFAGTGPDGRAYAVEPTLYCGACPECVNGDVQRCTGPGHGNLGVYSDGGMVEEITVPEYALLPLPEALPLRDACLVEPGAVAWHGIARAGVIPGERVAVVGGGSIGLLAAAAALRQGVEVDVEARHPHQRRACEHLGAGRVNGLYDVVVDAAGGGSALTRCAELARPGGRVIVVAVYFDTASYPGPASLIKELTYVNAMAYSHAGGHREFASVAAMLADQPEIAQTVITHRFPLERADEAFRVAADRAAGAIKVVLHP